MNTLTLDQMVDSGWLTPVQYLAPASPIDFDSGIDHLVVKPYLDLCRGKRALVFCNTVRAAEMIAERFNAREIPAAALLAMHNNEERGDLIASFERGDLQVLVTVNALMDERLPQVDAIIMANPIRSEYQFTRSIVTGMHPRIEPKHRRPGTSEQERKAAIAASDKPFCMILDCSRSYLRFGFPGAMPSTLERKQ